MAMYILGGTARQCTRLSRTWPLQEVVWLLGIAT